VVNDRSGSSGKDAFGTFLTNATMITVALARAAFFTGLGLSLFLLGFLGYFTVPFIFLAGALLLLASGSASRAYRRVRARMR
jgi:uncharacterized membrane protein